LQPTAYMAQILNDAKYNTDYLAQSNQSLSRLAGLPKGGVGGRGRTWPQINASALDKGTQLSMICDSCHLPRYGKLDSLYVLGDLRK
jgi:hypothetical protein